jgi:membrane fusion protein (multidrug efflux system)
VTIYHFAHSVSRHIFSLQRGELTICATPHAHISISEGKSLVSHAGSYDVQKETVGVAALPKQQSFLRRYRAIFIAGGPILIAGAAAFFILTSGKFQSTDNAYVQMAKAPVSASVGGRVTAVMVHENQRVQAGQPLFTLDAQDFVAEADQARAQLAQAELQVKSLRAAYQRAQAAVVAAQQTVDYTTREQARQKELVAAGVSSQQQLDEATHAAQNATSSLATARAEEAAALANLDGDPNAPVEEQPSVMAAQARLKKAEINQSYTTVSAPVAGIVTRVQQLQVGGYVNPSQTVFWLMSGEPWVEANFKEDQLAKMKIGQPVEIKVDAFPGQVLSGHVASFSPGTGSIFSALPAQNATGNWVKVTQRLPVEIAFDKAPPAMAGRSGLSAHVKVDVRGPGAQPAPAPQPGSAPK